MLKRRHACLVGSGARTTARLPDRTTPLHIAVTRGDLSIVGLLLDKSRANEQQKNNPIPRYNGRKDSFNEIIAVGSNGELPRYEKEDLVDVEADSDSITTEGSFVKVPSQAPSITRNEAMKDPDVYDGKILAWDSPVSPLHLAILYGHIDVIKMLVRKYGADVLLPVKIINPCTRDPQHAILTLILAAQLAERGSIVITKELLTLGASPAQADMNQVSALHYAVGLGKTNIVQALIECDKSAAAAALSHVVPLDDDRKTPARTCSTSAIQNGNIPLIKLLLQHDASPRILFN